MTHELLITFVGVAAGIFLIGSGIRAFDFRRYSLFTIGSYPRVERYSVQEHDRECFECGRRILAGERRVYGREVVIGGLRVVPIGTYRRERVADVLGGGSRFFCRSHADPAFREEIEPIDGVIDVPGGGAVDGPVLKASKIAVENTVTVGEGDDSDGSNPNPYLEMGRRFEDRIEWHDTTPAFFRRFAALLAAGAFFLADALIVETPPVEDEETPFEDVAQTSGTAFDIFAIALIVLPLAVVVGYLERVFRG